MTLFFNLPRATAENPYENIVDELGRFIDGVDSRDSPDVNLFCSCEPDSGDQACTEIDDSAGDARDIAVGIKHGLASRRPDRNRLKAGP